MNAEYSEEQQEKSLRISDGKVRPGEVSKHKSISQGGAGQYQNDL